MIMNFVESYENLLYGCLGLLALWYLRAYLAASYRLRIGAYIVERETAIREKILSLSDSDLNSLLDNNKNEIKSVYDDDDNHLGESRVLFLSDNAAEISIFIGDSKLSNQGYGTSVLIHLLEELFSRYNFRYIIF